MQPCSQLVHIRKNVGTRREICRKWVEHPLATAGGVGTNGRMSSIKRIKEQKERQDSQFLQEQLLNYPFPPKFRTKEKKLDYHGRHGICSSIQLLQKFICNFNFVLLLIELVVLFFLSTTSPFTLA